MKKKRTVSPKQNRNKRADDGRDSSNNHKTGNSGGSNGVQVGSDSHHNGFTPCANLVRDVVLEIFPGFMPEKEVLDSSCGAHHQNLLGCMIRRYLLQERGRQRQQNELVNTNIQRRSHDANETSKKKKKRRHKRSMVANECINKGEANEEKMSTDQACLSLEASTTPARDTLRGESKISPTSNEKMPLMTQVSHITRYPSMNTPTFDDVLDSILMDLDSSNPTWYEEKENRDIESFANFLCQKYEFYIEQQRNYQQKPKERSKLSTYVHNQNNGKIMTGMDLKDILPTISLDDIQNHACIIVKCPKCLTSAQAYLRSILEVDTIVDADMRKNGCWKENKNLLHFTSQRFLLLNHKSTALKRRSHHQISLPVSFMLGDSVEETFSYMAMDEEIDLEDGQRRKQTKEIENSMATFQPSFRLEMRPISHPTEKIRYLQMSPVATQDREGVNLKHPLNLLNIMNLIKYVLLPCGLAFEKTVHDSSLSDEQFNNIVQKTIMSSDEIRQELYAINDVINQIKEKFAQAEASNSRTAFDVTTSKLLNSCDELCELVLKQIGDFLLHLTKMACFVGWSLEYGPHLMTCLVDMWDQYDDTLNRLVEPTMSHRGKVISTCTRPGQVPQLYLDCAIRNSFQIYLGIKVTEIDKLKKHLEKALIDPDLQSYRYGKHQAPSPLVRLCVLAAFLSHASKASVNDVFPNIDDEDEFKQLLSERITLSQNVIKNATKENVLLREKQNYQSVQLRYYSTVKAVNAKLDELLNQGTSPPDFIRADYDKFAAMRHKLEQEHIRKSDIITPEDTRLLLEKSRQLLLQWIYLLCMRQFEKSRDDSFAVPSRLDNWMESISASDIVQTEPQEVEKDRCEGGEGERRVSSVLAALIYRWLEKRCSEWHAELTRDELLKSVDSEEPVAVIQEGRNKAGKKKKAKRKGAFGEKIISKYSINPLEREINNSHSQSEGVHNDEYCSEIDKTEDLEEKNKAKFSMDDDYVLHEGGAHFEASFSANDTKIIPPCSKYVEQIINNTTSYVDPILTSAKNCEEAMHSPMFSNENLETSSLQLDIRNDETSKIQASAEVLDSGQASRNFDELNIFDFKSSVGVIDNGQVISAEAFLVGRMELLLAEVKSKRSFVFALLSQKAESLSNLPT